jgi:hypothetical protein
MSLQARDGIGCDLHRVDQRLARVYSYTTGLATGPSAATPATMDADVYSIARDKAHSYGDSARRSVVQSLRDSIYERSHPLRLTPRRHWGAEQVGR